MPTQSDPPPSPSGLPEYLISQGRYWATTSEIEVLLERRVEILYPALADLKQQGRLFSPAQSLYVAVPPDYRSWGVVPADWFIEPMMRHLGRDYYVGFLSAAQRHGAAHQAPQVFQVVVDRPLRDRDLRRVRLRFIASRRLQEMATEQMMSHTGYYRVATRESTAVDLAWRPGGGAGLSNVATVLKELGELDGEKLARLAEVRGRAAGRRLGWLLDRFRGDVDLYWLRRIAEPERGVATPLSPGAPLRGSVDRGWGIKVNAEVEPDV